MLIFFSGDFFHSGLLTPIATFSSILLSALIAIRSWKVIANKNREHEIFKKRTDLRIQTLIDVQNFFDTVRFTHLREDEKYYESSRRIATGLMICGTKYEINLWYKFEATFADYLVDDENSEKEGKAMNVYREVRQELLESLRKDIGLEPLKK